MARSTLRGPNFLNRSLLAGVAVASAFAISLPITGIATVHAQGQALPDVKVNLPPSPKFDNQKAPEKYESGELSVYGLRKGMSKFMDKDVEIKAFVREIYVCPEEQRKCNERSAKKNRKSRKKGGLPGKPAAPDPNAECRPCDQPHFFVADTADMKLSRALLVADYPVKDWKTGKDRPFNDKLAKVGDQITVIGTFAINSITGFAASNGLLIHKKTSNLEGEVLLEGNAVLPPDAQTIELEGKAPEKLLQQYQ